MTTTRRMQATVRMFGADEAVELSADSLSAVLSSVQRHAEEYDTARSVGRRSDGRTVGYTVVQGGARRGHYEVCRVVSFGRGVGQFSPIGTAVVE